jgi:thioredoxin-related protein
VDWSQSDTTLVLALRKECHFCTASAGFYQRIAQQAAGQSNIRLVAVLPDSLADAKQYLESLKLPISEIKQSNLPGIGVQGTPTLILVDNKGIVQQSWVGRLPSDRETEVLKSLHLGQRS